MTCFFYIPQEHLPKSRTARSDLGSSTLITKYHTCLPPGQYDAYIFSTDILSSQMTLARVTSPAHNTVLLISS